MDRIGGAAAGAVLRGALRQNQRRMGWRRRCIQCGGGNHSTSASVDAEMLFGMAVSSSKRAETAIEKICCYQHQVYILFIER